MGRRGGSGPLERIRLPGIPLRILAAEQAPEEIRHEGNLRKAEKESGNSDKNIDRLQRVEEVILGRIVDPAHVAAYSKDVHREKGRVEEDVSQDEMNLRQGLVHHPAKHLWKPVINGGEKSEDDPGHDVMEVRHDIIGIMDEDVDRRGGHEDAAETADQEIGNEA